MIVLGPPVESRPGPRDPLWVIVALSGELDLASTHAYGELDRTVMTHPGAHILVDLSSVTFLDATALHAFASARCRAVADGGLLSLYGASTFAQHLLRLWDLESVGSEPSLPDDVA